MPLIKSAKKKLRQDKKVTIRNKSVKNTYKELVKAALKSPKGDVITKAVSATDKAAKKRIIHKNKASHIKARLYKLISEQGKTTKTA